MSNEKGILYNKAQKMAKATRLSVNDLERITDEDRGWIRKFLNNDIRDPGSIRLEGFVRDIAIWNKNQRKAKR